jgi:hypothetical protein
MSTDIINIKSEDYHNKWPTIQDYIDMPQRAAINKWIKSNESKKHEIHMYTPKIDKFGFVPTWMKTPNGLLIKLSRRTHIYDSSGSIFIDENVLEFNINDSIVGDGFSYKVKQLRSHNSKIVFVISKLFSGDYTYIFHKFILDDFIIYYENYETQCLTEKTLIEKNAKRLQLIINDNYLIHEGLVRPKSMDNVIFMKDGFYKPKIRQLGKNNMQFKQHDNLFIGSIIRNPFYQSDDSVGEITHKVNESKFMVDNPVDGLSDYCLISSI